VKTLHLLRHAKSDWSDERLSDHERPLNKRGRKARETVAKHVAKWHVDLVVCSTAKRARETAEPVVAALGCEVRYDDALYGATARELLDIVRVLTDDLRFVMLVGHNPSMEDFTELLCGETPRYPTAALGTVALDVRHWADVDPGSGSLVGLVTPKQSGG
jgi:phosphohistidine phosphatase